MAQPIRKADDTEEALFEEARAQTERAHREFIEQVSCIPNVTIERRGKTLFDRSFAVTVPDLWSPEFDRVVTVRGNMYRTFPLARLEVSIHGLRELNEARGGHDESDD